MGEGAVTALDISERRVVNGTSGEVRLQDRGLVEIPVVAALLFVVLGVVTKGTQEISSILSVEVRTHHKFEAIAVLVTSFISRARRDAAAAESSRKPGGARLGVKGTELPSSGGPRTLVEAGAIGFTSGGGEERRSSSFVQGWLQRPGARRGLWTTCQ